VNVDALLLPELPLLPEQLPREHPPCTPEFRLWARVFADAVSLLKRRACYTKRTCWERELEQTRQWIADEGPGVGSLSYVCNLFGLDVHATREALREIVGRDVMTL
jgi:hypothetical protein